MCVFRRYPICTGFRPRVQRPYDFWLSSFLLQHSSAWSPRLQQWCPSWKRYVNLSHTWWQISRYEQMFLFWSMWRCQNTSCLFSPPMLLLVEKHLALLAHSAIRSKHQWCEHAVFDVENTLQVLSFFGLFMVPEYRGCWFSGLARGVNMRDSDIEKCCLSPLPETVCLYVKPWIIISVCWLVPE